MGATVSRVAWILATLAVVGLVGFMTYDQIQRGPNRIRAENDGGSTLAAASASASASSAPTPLASASGSGAPMLGDAGLVGVDTGDGGLSLFGLLDAGGMPNGAPRSVRLGVVLVQWAGAEGASSSARARPDALKRAQELAEKAKADFKATVKEGDSGSAEDVGRIPRGVLDRATEVAVFSMSAGDISEPLETPRGYWIVKRIE